jgi:hypothetical protein
MTLANQPQLCFLRRRKIVSIDGSGDDGGNALDLSERGDTVVVDDRVGAHVEGDSVGSDSDRSESTDEVPVARREGEQPVQEEELHGENGGGHDEAVGCRRGKSMGNFARGKSEREEKQGENAPVSSQLR